VFTDRICYEANIFDQRQDPTYGTALLLAFIVVIIGGLGSLRGTVIAALLIGLSDGIISVFFSPTLAKILATLLVALVLVFRPQGLFGRRPA
jgi:branched-chain amino acid transport system permease protein